MEFYNRKKEASHKKVVILNKSFATPNGCCGFEIFTDKIVENFLEKNFSKIMEIYWDREKNVLIFLLNFPLNFRFLSKKNIELQDIEEMPILIYKNEIIKGMKNILEFLKKL